MGPDQQREFRANAEATATYYKERYWTTKDRESALRALRYYHEVLRRVRLRDPAGTYPLLHSIALYCELRCPRKAEAIASELRGGYPYPPQELGQALSYCGW
jgi:hypothetical protein